MLRITAMDMRPAAANYLLNDAGCQHRMTDEERDLAQAAMTGDAAAYYAAAQRDGEAPGRWRGAGSAGLGLDPGGLADEARVRTLLGELKHPETGAQLGGKPRAYKTRDERLSLALAVEPEATPERIAELKTEIAETDRRNVGFYDFTFTAPKSVSIYHAALIAAGQLELAQAVRQAHQDALAESLDYLDAEGCYTRTGRHQVVNGASSGRFERGQGFVAIEFEHSTSREEDPHLHTHLAVANRVRCADGQWRAVHGGAFQQHKAFAAEKYERALAQKIEARTPARFAVAEHGMSREILGISPADIADSSNRRAAILAKQQEFLTEFTARHGREPTLAERRLVNQTAWAEDRKRKSGRGPDQQLNNWASQDHIDGPGMVRTVHADGRDADRARPASAPESAQVIERALAIVQSRSATFKASELAAELALQAGHTITDEQLKALVTEGLQAGGAHGAVRVSRPDPAPVPDWWRDDRSGGSVFTDPGVGAYALASHLGTEQALVAWAAQPTGRTITAAEARRMDTALVTEGVRLSEDQRQAVFGVLGSNHAADVLMAAAGTGKSHTTGVLGRLWTQAHGGQVLGVATSERASEVLREDGLEALNTTQFLMAYEPDPNTGRPRKRLGHRDLLVVDEASMVTTQELSRIQQLATQSGAKVLYTGDDQQLGAVGAAGAFSLLAADNGSFGLDTVHRFAEEWERDASLRWRDGDSSVLDLYEQHGRLRGGTREDIQDQAVRSYAADVLDGRSSVLVTSTNEEAAEVSLAVQHQLVRAGTVNREPGAVALLADGAQAYRGDVIQARRNRYPEVGGHVTNRELLHVVGGLPDGGLVAYRPGTEDTVALPADYLAEHTTLGYAGTEHAFQGVSVDTAHSLTSGYVGATRGKERNTIYVETQRRGSPEDTALDTTPRAQLAGEITRDDQQRSAIAEWRAEIEASKHIGTVARIWDEVGAELDSDRHRDLILDTVGENLADRIDFEDGRDALLASLRRADMRGYDIERVWRTAVDQRDFAGAHDLARVLRGRFERLLAAEAEPDSAASWAGRTHTATTGDLGRFHGELAALMDSRTRDLGHAQAERPAAWALELIGDVPDDQQQRAEWQQRAGLAAADRELRAVPDEAVSLGAGPHEDRTLDRLSWEQASRATNRPTDGLDYRTRSDGALHQLVQAWDRAQAWAPEYVADQLGHVHEQAQLQQVEATMLAAEAGAQADADRAGQQHQAAEAAARTAERLQSRAGILEGIHQARQQWLAHTEADQDAAQQARAELDRRGMPRDQERSSTETAEQETLFDVATPADLSAQQVEAPQRSLFDSQQAEAEHGLGEQVEPEPVQLDEQQQQLFAAEPDAATQARLEPVQTQSGQPELGPEPAGDGAERLAAAEQRARLAVDLIAQRQQARMADDQQRQHRQQQRAAEAEQVAEAEQEAPQLSL